MFKCTTLRELFNSEVWQILVRERSALATIIVILFVSVCQSVRMSVRVFKMLLVRQFLSEWADFLTRWSPPGENNSSSRIFDRDFMTSVITSWNFAWDPYVQRNGSVDAHCTQDRWVSLILLRGVIRSHTATMNQKWLRRTRICPMLYVTLE